MTAEAAAHKLDVDQALKQFLKDPDWKTKVGLGSMLTAACFLTGVMDIRHLLLLPVALAIAGLLCGYLLRIVRHRVNKPESDRLPEWNDWPDLFMSGITWIAIQFGIGVIAFTIVTSTLILSVYAALTPNAYAVPIAETSLLVVVLVAFWTSFLSTYLWVNFAVEERVGGGWAIRKVSRHIRKNPSEFWMAWALSSALQFVAVLIPSLTVIGVFIVPTTLFAAQMISAYILAQAWRTVED